MCIAEKEPIGFKYATGIKIIKNSVYLFSIVFTYSP